MSETITNIGDIPSTGTITCPEQNGDKARENSGEKITQKIKAFKEAFNCQKCGKCCEEGLGVALWPHEFLRLQKIEKHLLRHIAYLNRWHVLKMPCFFYNQKKHKCRIYDKRPIACQLYPIGVNLDMSIKYSQNCPEVKNGGYSCLTE
jgi:Fe-S-cluster containining protein